MAMPMIAPSGKPMPISVNVTQVCWSKSPVRKPAMVAVNIRLGLLIKKGSIQRPEAICQSSKNPPTMPKRISVMRRPRELTPSPCSGAPAASWAAISECSRLGFCD
jgi:hypothetical protein